MSKKTKVRKQWRDMPHGASRGDAERSAVFFCDTKYTKITASPFCAPSAGTRGHMPFLPPTRSYWLDVTNTPTTTPNRHRVVKKDQLLPGRWVSDLVLLVPYRHLPGALITRDGWITQSGRPLSSASVVAPVFELRPLYLWTEFTSTVHWKELRLSQVLPYLRIFLSHNVFYITVKRGLCYTFPFIVITIISEQDI